jgi:sugar lactone lactonase YvrE
MRPFLPIGLLMGICLVVSCVGKTPVLTPTTTRTKPSAPPIVTPSDPSAAVSFGKVLDQNGLPAANVLVRAYLLSNNGGGVLSNNGGGLVSDHGQGLVATQINQFTRTGAAFLGLLQANPPAGLLSTHTGPDGTFQLAPAPGSGPLNIEAIGGKDVAAIAQNVQGTNPGITLRLAFTGTISGKVTAPKAPGVTNFEGVDVFVPGTSYLAKTDAGGHFQLINVATGAFTLVASKAGLGRASVSNVGVMSKQDTAAADLAMTLVEPHLTGLLPANGGPGIQVTLSGDHFGTSSGDVLQVSFNGAIATDVTRIDDHTLKASVPHGASLGDVVVSVGGVTSNAMPFAVLKSLLLAPPRGQFLVGESQSYTVTAKDSSDGAVLAPAVTWGVDGPALTVDSTGKVNALAPGQATLTVTSGSLSFATRLTVLASYATVSTFAGDASTGLVDGPVDKARFHNPSALVLDAAGNFFLADQGNNAVRKIDMRDPAQPIVSTIAGGTGSGYQDGPGASALFNAPTGLVIASDGSLFVSDANNQRIRQITLTDPTHPIVTTYAGEGHAGTLDGAALTAQFNIPNGLAIDAAGTLYVADTANQRIRKIDRTDPAHPVVTTLCGSGIRGFADGKGSNAIFSNPGSLALDARGNLYVGDTNNNRVRMITPDGTTSTFAGNGQPGWADDIGPKARFNDPNGLWFDPAGNLFVADQGQDRVRKITQDGTVSTVAGSGEHGYVDGKAPDARFITPSYVLGDGHGTIYVVEYFGNRIRKIVP